MRSAVIRRRAEIQHFVVDAAYQQPASTHTNRRKLMITH
jgi:hypothetical protein